MSQETLFFLQPTASGSNPNFANAEGNAQFFGYSHAATNSLTSAQLNALVQGGVASAIANANATFISDPAFSSLFTETAGTGQPGTSYYVESQSQTQVIATFDVNANQTFSFDFNAEISLSAKEIETPAEANEANSKTSFIVLDTSNINQPQIIDYFGISGELISGEGIGDVDTGSSNNVNFTTNQSIDLDGNNGIDSIDANAFTGSYQRSFNTATHLTLVKLNSSEIELSGDGLAALLGNDVIIGGIGDDLLNGTSNQDKFYGSFGNDTIRGYNSDDILEGGEGDDHLQGDDGNDKLHGSFGNDFMDGGASQDTLVGGSGNDWLKGQSGDDRLWGGDGNDTLDGGQNQDQLYGEAGNDNLSGGEGDNTLDGGDGADQLNGGQHQDRLYGGKGQDTLSGNSGDDRLYGGDGGDRLLGDSGHDQLYGEAGNDTLIGGTWNDQMTGGAGSDRFVFEQGNSFLSGEYDRILDFQIGVDQIEFHNFSNFNSSNGFNQLISNGYLRNAGSNTMIQLNTGGQLLIEGVSLNELSASDFQFV
jgi:Ca2+-binding RTX toxin-like protein